MISLISSGRMSVVFLLSAVLIFGSICASQAATSLPKIIETTKDRATMVLIPGGEFIYGINPAERKTLLKRLRAPELEVFEFEFNEQRIHLPDYYIDKYEVTNAQYGAFLRETGRAEPSFWHSKVYSDPKQPVVGVSWDDAVAYAEWTGKRLPTEEEWEKAARGTDGFFWPWGNEPSAGKYNGAAQRNYKPMDVGSFKAGASPYGVMDMAGNVYELTTGKWVNGRLAMRGGSYLNGGAHTRTMFRWALKGERGVEFLGFRCVLDVERVSPPTTLEYKHVDAAPAELWGVVYGADKEIDKARYEVETIANKLGLSDANIYYRNGWYRSVATTTDRSHAGDLLVKARSRRDGAYIVRMSAWCPSPFEEDGYFACPSR